MTDKNIFEYGYAGDEQVTISAKEFMILKSAVDAGIASLQRVEYPEVIMYLDAESGDRVENPSDEDLATGKVILSTDKEATFSNRNAKISYDAMKLTPEMLYAQEIVVDVHARNVRDGIAKPQEELKMKMHKQNG